MYLDDLPSATMIGNKTYYDTHIPLGYITFRNVKPNYTVIGMPEIPAEPRIFIYNHLDIEVLVHENMLTEMEMTTVHEQFLNIDFSEQFGGKYKDVKLAIP